MSKIIILCALIGIASAGNLLAAAPAVAYQSYHAAPAVSHVSYGAPIAYSAPVAVHAPAIGTSHQSTLRSLDGNSAVSHYSKSVDTAFSSVRKVDTRVTNDAKILTPALAYAAAPIVKTGHLVAPAQYAYAAPAAHLTYAAAAPAAHYAYAPAAPAHVVSHTTFSGLGTAYAF